MCDSEYLSGNRRMVDMFPNTIRENDSEAKKEIRSIMYYCNLCTRSIGISFIDEPRNLSEKMRMNAWFILCFLSIFLMLCGEICHMMRLLTNSKAVLEEFVAIVHLFMYVNSSLAKLAILWYKRDVFKKLMRDLVDIWPKNTDKEEYFIKKLSITALRQLNYWYILWSIVGLSFYCVTPVALAVYHMLRNSGPTEPVFIWFIDYPFDKRNPVNHKIAYIYEMFAGYSSVGSMLSSEVTFTVMAGTITMLLRILKSKVRKLASSPQQNGQDRQLTDDVKHDTADNRYDEMVNVIKIHQKLISYSIDLEDAFSLVNLSNVLLSSMMICCAVFNIVLLDPWMEIANKFYLVAVLTEIGIMCWYADEIYTSSLSVADAVYESAWYEAPPQCRRAMLLMILRSQKPICFTAYKFSNITLTTYSSILTTSYSYFALIYTMFRR